MRPFFSHSYVKCLFISFIHLTKIGLFVLKAFLFKMETGMTNSYCNFKLLNGSASQINGPWRMKLKIEECFPKSDYLEIWISNVEMRHTTSC